MFWWMDRVTTKRREGRTPDIGEDGAFVFANCVPFQGIEVGFKVFLLVLPGIERKSKAGGGREGPRG